MPDLFCRRKSCHAPAELEEGPHGPIITCTKCAAKSVNGIGNAVCEGFGTMSQIRKMEGKREKEGEDVGRGDDSRQSKRVHAQSEIKVGGDNAADRQTVTAPGPIKDNGRYECERKEDLSPGSLHRAQPQALSANQEHECSGKAQADTAARSVKHQKQGGTGETRPAPYPRGKNPGSRGHAGLKPDKVALIAKLYGEGKTIEEIVRIVPFCRKTIKKYVLQTHGAVRPAKRGPKNLKKARSSKPAPLPSTDLRDLARLIVDELIERMTTKQITFELK